MEKTEWEHLANIEKPEGFILVSVGNNRLQIRGCVTGITQAMNILKGMLKAAFGLQSDLLNHMGDHNAKK